MHFRFGGITFVNIKCQGNFSFEQNIVTVIKPENLFILIKFQEVGKSIEKTGVNLSGQARHRSSITSVTVKKQM